MNLRSITLSLSLLVLACGKVAPEDGDAGDPDHRSDGGPGTGGSDGGADGASLLAVDRDAIDFGDVVRGAASSGARFTVRNDGDGPSGDLSTALMGDVNEFEVVSDDCRGAALAAGDTCAVEVRFAPGMAGTWIAAVVVTGDPGGEVRVDLAGHGLAPGALRIDLDSKNFGRVNLDDVSGTTTFEIRNTGDAVTGALSVELSDPDSFRVMDDGCAGQMLAGSGTCTIAVRFAPAAVGSANGSLTVSASPGGAVAASLGGTGTATVTVARAGTGSGTISSSPAGINSCTATSCTAEFDTPAVSLSATAAQGSQFMTWGTPCSGTGTCALDLDGGNVAMAATFEVLRTLTLATSGSGTLTAQGCGGSSCSYPNGTSVVLTATPGSNYSFRNWTNCSSSNTTCVVTLTGNVTVTANFQTFRLAVTLKDGASSDSWEARLTLSTGQICVGGTCNYNWANPTTVTITRVLGPCTYLVAWGGACSGTSSTCTVSVNNASQAIDANATFDHVKDCNNN